MTSAVYWDVKQQIKQTKVIGQNESLFFVVDGERRGGSWERQAPAPPPMDR